MIVDINEHVSVISECGRQEDAFQSSSAVFVGSIECVHPAISSERGCEKACKPHASTNSLHVRVILVQILLMGDQLATRPTIDHHPSVIYSVHTKSRSVSIPKTHSADQPPYWPTIFTSCISPSPSSWLLSPLVQAAHAEWDQILVDCQEPTV